MSATLKSNNYYNRLENGKCICLNDTTGLSDVDKIEKKKKILISIKIIYRELLKLYLKIKCI